VDIHDKRESERGGRGFGTTYQTIRGFGGSTAWLGQLTTQQANALFSPTTGLGLSILRVRIDPTGAAGSNYVTVNWTQELANAQAAIAANSNAIVFASPWTPPTAMKTSSANQPYYSGASACSPGPDYCGGYLDPSHYGDYANYLEDFVTYFKNNNVDLHAISMQNEPDWSAQPTENYESCSWTAQQMDTWVASLTANSATNPITTKLIMPESLNFNPRNRTRRWPIPTRWAMSRSLAGTFTALRPLIMGLRSVTLRMFG